MRGLKGVEATPWGRTMGRGRGARKRSGRIRRMRTRSPRTAVPHLYVLLQLVELLPLEHHARHLCERAAAGLVMLLRRHQVVVALKVLRRAVQYGGRPGIAERSSTFCSAITRQAQAHEHHLSSQSLV